MLFLLLSMHTMFDYGQSIFSRQLLCRLPSGEVYYPSQHGIIILTRLIFTSLPQNNNLYYIFEIDFVGLYQCLHNKHGWGAKCPSVLDIGPFLSSVSHKSGFMSNAEVSMEKRFNLFLFAVSEWHSPVPVCVKELTSNTVILITVEWSIHIRNY